MSLFGAARKTSTFQKAKERMAAQMAESSGTEQSVTSSVFGEQLDKITGRVYTPEEMATNSEIAHDLSELAREDQQRQFFGTPEYERLKAGEEKDDYKYALHKPRMEDEQRRRENSQATSRVETGQLPSNLDDMRAYSDLTGKTEVTGIMRYGSDHSSELSPPPTTEYGGTVSFPPQTPRESTKYEGSIVALPLSAIPQDPFVTPRERTGINASRYIWSEENISKQAAEEEEMEGGVPETWRRSSTPTFENSDSDEAMTEVEWRAEEP